MQDKNINQETVNKDFQSYVNTNMTHKYIFRTNSVLLDPILVHIKNTDKQITLRSWLVHCLLLAELLPPS